MYNYLHKNPSFATEYFSSEDWDQLVEHTGTALPVEKTTELQKNIFTRVQKAASLRRILIKSAVAALLVIGIGLYAGNMFSSGPLIRITIKEAVISNLQTRYNQTAMPERLKLPDNSTVILSPNSKIQYLKSFRKDRRVVFLEGTAIFQVTKDASRPFTVKSYGIATTALGTRFKVVAQGGSSSRSVTLYEGKVVVRADNHKDKRIYLLPGYRLTYNKWTEDFKVNEFTLKNVQGGVPHAGIALTAPSTDPEVFKRSFVGNARFENEPLAEVLHYLAARFHHEIKFDKSAVRNINFVGTIHQQDSLYPILEDIALINHLTVERTKKDSTVFSIK